MTYINDGLGRGPTAFVNAALDEPPSAKPFYSGRGGHGFTLLELMVTVVIVGILAAIAYPAYTQQVQKTRRSEAKAALTDAAVRMEKYYGNNKTYNITDITRLGYSSNPFTTEKGFYRMSLVAANASDTTYRIQAIAQGAQASDTTCATMAINSQGSKEPAACW
jgi:type IV pilus assembly protein PilE